MKNHRLTVRGRAAAVALGLLTTVTSTVAPALQATASASLPTALQRCQSGAAPDTSQTVYHPGTQVQVMLGEAQTSAQGDTLAHELGHSLGLSHTWEDPNYPRSDGGLGPFVALHSAPSFSLVSGKTRLATPRRTT